MTETGPPRATTGAWLWLAGVMLAMIALPAWVPSVWLRMAAIEGVAAVLALRWLPLPWRALLRPPPRELLLGLLGALVLWVLGKAATVMLRGTDLLAQTQSIYAWTEQLPMPAVVVLLPFITIAEDIVWRGGATWLLAQRMPWWSAAPTAGLLFALAHLGSGPAVLLLAAFACGTLWSALALRRGGLAAVFTMHLAWDVLVLFVARYE